MVQKMNEESVIIYREVCRKFLRNAWAYGKFRDLHRSKIRGVPNTVRIIIL